MKTLFVIPARGGSKGIPGKNIKPLHGKPLILYAVENARAVAGDADICVSTDSEAIRDVVESAGLHVPFMRPASLATDSAGSREVLLHALDFYASTGICYDRVVLLQATSPFTTPADIEGALALWTRDTDLVVSVKEAATNPYYNAYETNENGSLVISKGPGTYTRRQDAPKVWEYNGAIYIFNADSLRKGWFRSFKKITPYEMSADSSVDLDTPLDWLVAEAVMKNRFEGNGLKG